MTPKEYKDCYQQALSIIHETIVGEPVLLPQGRRVEIDGQDYDDTDVIKIARGLPR